MKRTLALLVAAVGLLLSPVVEAQTAPPAPAAPAVEAAAAILVDLGRDDVLFARNVHARRAPASLTKVVTALVARERYALDEVVTIGPKAAAIHGSRLGVEEGMSFTVLDLLYALLIDSGNDAANALAEHNPGGYRHFVSLMNEKARALGAFESSFANPHGLDEQGHYTSAWDLALFGRQLMADPVLAGIVASPKHAVPWPKGRTRTITNHNKLIGSYEGAIGIKTGFTNQSGRSLMGAARRSGQTMLSVVLGAVDQYAETKSMFAYGAGRVGSATRRLGGLPAMPAAEPVPAPATAPHADPRDTHPYRWAALMALLAAAMLASLPRARSTDPLEDASWYHPALDLRTGPVRWESGPISAAGDHGRSRRRATEPIGSA